MHSSKVERCVNFAKTLEVVMCGTVGSYRSNKKGKVMIGGIAAANLRSLYFHALLPERERFLSSGIESLLLLLLAVVGDGGGRLELGRHVGD